MSIDLEQLKCALVLTTHQSLPSVFDSLYGSSNNADCETPLVAVINELVKNGNTRLMGLELLQCALPYYSLNCISENALYWSSHCVVQNVYDASKSFKLNILARILNSVDDVDSFNKKFAIEYLPSVWKSCSIYRCKEEQIACLNCLTQCIRKYPTWFGNYKQKIELLLLKCLSGWVDNCTAICFLYFLQIGGAGENGINYINSFCYYFDKLCATIQVLFDKFFNDSWGYSNSEKNYGDVFEINLNDDDANKLKEATADTIINCLCFLKTMIKSKYPVEKRINMKFLIDIINRGLGTHICFSLDKINYCLALKRIHLELLKLLLIFTKGYLQNLLPFEYVVKKNLLDILKRSCKCHCFDFSTSFKAHTYKVLIFWLSLTGDINQLHLQEVLIPAILKDISPIRKTTSLKEKRSEKCSYDNTNEMKFAKKRTSVREYHCVYALEALKLVLTSFPVSTNKTLLQDLISFIVETINDIEKGKISEPYCSQLCQLKLYEVLIFFLKKEDVQFPSLHLLINILARGLKNTNRKIAQTSSEGLCLLEKICSPVCPTFFMYDDRKSFMNLEFQDDTMFTDAVENNTVSEVNEKNQVSLINIKITEEVATSSDDIPISSTPIIKEGEHGLIADDTNSDVKFCEEFEQSSAKLSETSEKSNEEDVAEMFFAFQNVVQE